MLQTAAPFCQIEMRPDGYFTGIYILQPQNKSNLIPVFTGEAV